MRWIAPLACLAVLGCGESTGGSSSSATNPGPPCVDLSSVAAGLVGTYLGQARATLVNPVDAGVSNDEPPGRVDVVYLECDELVVAADFGAVCGKLGSPEFRAAIQSPTQSPPSFILRFGSGPFCLRATKECPGSAAFFLASGSVSEETLTLQVSGGVYFDPGGDARCSAPGAWPYSYTFTGTRTHP